MEYLELSKNIYWVGAKDRDLKVFDIIMKTDEGTTYNSYLINDDKVALIDTVKNNFFQESIDKVKKIIGNKSIDYIVVNHTELDHSGSINDFLKEYPNATVIATKAAIMYLSEIINTTFKSIDISSIKELSLGENTLQFITAPNLHWPDTMFTYVKNKEILFTCDFFGCHYCPDESMYTEYNDVYIREMKYYYQTIMSPFYKFVNNALDKINNLSIKMIAPSHGPIHTEENIDKIKNAYYNLSKKDSVVDNKISIFYISAYGNTEKMANYIKMGLEKKGFLVGIYEITSYDTSELVKIIETSKGILVGTPTINQDAVRPAWDLLNSVCPINVRGKVASAFGSFGWSGEGVPMILSRMKDLKFNVLSDGLRFKFVPYNKEYADADEFIEKYIKLLK
ncbi:FprA family A-type flavoprotein [uncultured Clostridium sp.]|uniref:FprA family A-type flavoprotein n=1 Tax=uncultured Clostridium sp. TaxID=59620 RepID=UPI0025EF65D2|nr:FprA family A-type flavoprotein [uncultured Clostridium sp.]